MTDPALLETLRQTLERDPRNGPLWVHYAELLEGAGRDAEALAALRTAAQITQTKGQAERRLVSVLRKTGELAEALIRVEALLERRDDPELRLELACILEARGDAEGAQRERELVARVRPDLLENEPAATPTAGSVTPAAGTPALAPVTPEESDPEDWVSQFDWGDLRVTFDDVAGLEEVKKQIHLRIIAPFKNPEIYEAFGREGGGGLMLYGPPGCGKTFIARAAAGEVGARFVSVSIHEVVDKFWGESEKFVHALFEDARQSSPTVLFFDEFDALGSSRRGGDGGSQFWKTLVDQLLQEMDGVDAKNRDVLLFAATNTPWNVDPAFRRPGRFDRVLFVSPPDLQAREAILARHLQKLPGGGELAYDQIAASASLFTGADLKALAERAAEAALERSLDTGNVHQVSQADLTKAFKASKSTALEWLSTARNYARYSNEGGQYDDLVSFLKRAKKW